MRGFRKSEKAIVEKTRAFGGAGPASVWWWGPGRWLLAGLLALAASGGCGGFVPYKAIADAAQSEERPMAQAEDRRHKLQLRRAIVQHDLLKGLEIAPYVVQGRAFLVGRVETEAQAEALLSMAEDLGVFRSVHGYLPVSPDEHESSFTADASHTAEIKARLVADPSVAASRVDVKVLDGHVVLVGVVGPREKEDIVKIVESVDGVKGVTDFLMTPDPEYERLRRGLR